MTHEAPITNIQNKDRVIAEYHGKTEWCSHAIDFKQKAGTSSDVMIKVIKIWLLILLADLIPLSGMVAVTVFLIINEIFL